ncbi:MAG: hypothetical protein P8163_22865 [Candidatus Thiodiazotropha sp.]
MAQLVPGTINPLNASGKDSPRSRTGHEVVTKAYDTLMQKREFHHAGES